MHTELPHSHHLHYHANARARRRLMTQMRFGHFERPQNVLIARFRPDVDDQRDFASRKGVLKICTRKIFNYSTMFRSTDAASDVSHTRVAHVSSYRENTLAPASRPSSGRFLNGELSNEASFVERRASCRWLTREDSRFFRPTAPSRRSLRAIGKHAKFRGKPKQLYELQGRLIPTYSQ